MKDPSRRGVKKGLEMNATERIMNEVEKVEDIELETSMHAALTGSKKGSEMNKKQIDKEARIIIRCLISEGYDVESIMRVDRAEIFHTVQNSGAPQAVNERVYAILDTAPTDSMRGIVHCSGYAVG